MPQSEIDAIRALLSAKPRPVGWAERRAAHRRGRLGLAGGRRREARAGRPRWRPRRVVDRAGQRRFARAAVFPWRRLLLGLDRQPSPPGDRGRPRRRHPHARGRLSARARASLSGRASTTRSRPGAFCAAQGIAAGHIAVGGDSAGGGLTLALISRLRDAGEELPACAWLVSPWTDLTMSGDTLATKDAVDPLIHKAYLDELARRLRAARHGPRAIRGSRRCSPICAGLPPILIQVGSCRDAARGFDAPGRGRRRGGRAGDAARSGRT